MPRVMIYTKGVAQNAASRYRFLQYRPYLEAAGLEVDVRPLFGAAYYAALRERGWRRTAARAKESLRGLATRALDLTAWRGADLVVIENQLFPYEPGLFEAVARLGRAVPTIVEFDDAIYETPGHRAKFTRLLPKASRVIVGNAELARFAAPLNRCVSIVPTTVDMARYDAVPGPVRTDGVLRLGWIGQPATEGYLRMVAEPLRELARELPLELVVISGREVRLDGVPTRFVAWSEAGEVAALKELDIGLMPLPDTAWTRGKCALKLIQYMAAGVVGVASPVGMNVEVVRDGVNGLLADGPRAWYEGIKRLAREEAWRHSLARAGHDRAAREYGLSVWGPRVAELYVETAASGRKG